MASAGPRRDASMRIAQEVMRTGLGRAAGHAAANAHLDAAENDSSRSGGLGRVAIEGRAGPRLLPRNRGSLAKFRCYRSRGVTFAISASWSFSAAPTAATV